MDEYLMDVKLEELETPDNTHIVSESKYVCGLCNKFFMDLNNTKIHMKRVHSYNKDYNCDECDKSFKTKSDLNRHKKQVHKDLKRKLNIDNISDTCKRIKV